MTDTIGSTTAQATTQVHGHHHRPHVDMDKALSPAADLLGTSVDDLKTAMKDGTTLDQLAAAKGISHDDLVGAIAKGLDAARPAGAPTGVDSTAMAERIASGQRPRRPGGPPPADAPTAAQSTNPATGVNTASGLDQLATLLKVDPQALQNGLSTGSSLSDILKSSGVDESALGQQLLQGFSYDAYA